MKLLGKKGRTTRQAILASAREAFIRLGYDRAGVREIAENAGVTAMLVNRYFGSKERLFEEVIELTLTAPGILTQELLRESSDLPVLCRDIAAALVARAAPDATSMDGFLILLRSVSNLQATEILRRKFEIHFAQPLATLLPGSDPRQRAALFLGVVAGFQVMYQIVGLTALTEAKHDDLARRLAALFIVLAGDGEPTL